MKRFLSVLFILAGLMSLACRREAEPTLPEGNKYPTMAWTTTNIGIDNPVSTLSLTGEFDMAFLHFGESVSVSLYTPKRVSRYVDIHCDDHGELVVDGVGTRDFAWAWYEDSSGHPKYYPRPVSIVPGVVTINVKTLEHIRLLDSFLMMEECHIGDKLIIESRGKAALYADYALYAGEIEIFATDSSCIRLNNIVCEQLTIHSESSRDIVVAGRASNVMLTFDGDGAIDTTGLDCDSMEKNVL